MQRHDDCPALAVFQLDVTAALAYLREASLAQSPNHIAPGDTWEVRTQAAISIEVMIGGSTPSGRGASSK